MKSAATHSTESLRNAIESRLSRHLLCSWGSILGGAVLLLVSWLLGDRADAALKGMYGGWAGVLLVGGCVSLWRHPNRDRDRPGLDQSVRRDREDALNHPLRYTLFVWWGFLPFVLLGLSLVVAPFALLAATVLQIIAGCSLIARVLARLVLDRPASSSADSAAKPEPAALSPSVAPVAPLAQRHLRQQLVLAFVWTGLALAGMAGLRLAEGLLGTELVRHFNWIFLLVLGMGISGFVQYRQGCKNQQDLEEVLREQRDERSRYIHDRAGGITVRVIFVAAAFGAFAAMPLNLPVSITLWAVTGVTGLVWGTMVLVLRRRC